jgi:hypothetical protein
VTSLPVPSPPLGGNSDSPPGKRPSDPGELVGADARREAGPDPVVGAGVTLLGIFLMGAGGATDAHWVFDAGVLLAVLGAAVFVGCVALSAYKLRRVDRSSS